MNKISRAYTLASVSWPRNVWGRDDLIDDLNLVWESADSIFQGELCIRWWMIGGSSQEGHARVEAFDDAWDCLAEIAPILARLPKTYMSISPQDLITLLEGYGWEPSEYHGQHERNSRPSGSPWRS